MHKFLKSIGFSDIGNKKMEALLEELVEHPGIVKVTRDSEGNEFAEISRSYEKNGTFGITVRGTYDENEVFHMDYYYPYVEGFHTTTQEKIDIEKHAEKESYAGVCDDVRLGVTLIFYVQNVADYLSEQMGRKNPVTGKGARLAGLSVDGKIILPVYQSEKAKTTNSTRSDRNQLMAEAREGNEDAIENLTLDDMDTYNRISKRMVNEDILSIVDSTFMPYGIESDQYGILGTIQELELFENQITKENIYCMTIECNDVIFDVCINEKDLLGEPAVGRRFKGNIWMQGWVDLQ